MLEKEMYKTPLPYKAICEITFEAIAHSISHTDQISCYTTHTTTSTSFTIAYRYSPLLLAASNKVGAEFNLLLNPFGASAGDRY